MTEYQCVHKFRKPNEPQVSTWVGVNQSEAGMESQFRLTCGQHGRMEVPFEVPYEMSDSGWTVDSLQMNGRYLAELLEDGNTHLV